jgi:hypothetical protein
MVLLAFGVAVGSRGDHLGWDAMRAKETIARLFQDPA